MALKILVKAPNWVGDCILATPAIAFLRSQFPDAAILIMARPMLCSLFEHNPNASGTIPFDDKKIDPEILAGVKASKFDAVVILPNSIRSAWYAKKLGIPVRVGYRRNWRRLLLTHGVDYDPFEWRTPVEVKRSSLSIQRGPFTKWPVGRPPRHMVQYYMNVAETTVRALGNSEAKAPACVSRGVPNLVLPLDPEARTRIGELINTHQLNNRRLVGICPAATGGTAKCWPNELQAELIKMIAQNYPETAFISTAIPPEAEAAENLQRLMGDIPLYRLGEETQDLHGMIALIDRLKLYVTNDSGSMHIAAARQVPIVAAFGPTDWNVTCPWSGLSEIVRMQTECAPCLHKICPIDHRCMKGVTVDMMYEACVRMLERKSTGDTGRFQWGTDTGVFNRKKIGL